MACLGLGLGLPSKRPPVSWEGTLPSLRSFVTANYNQPNPHNQPVMAVPPTVTAPGATQPSGLTNEYRYNVQAPELTFYGGGNKPNFVDYRRFPVATVASTGGNVGDGQQAIAFRMTAVADAQRVSFRVLGSSTTVYRFIVNGQYVSLTSLLTGGAAGRQYYLLDFGTKAVRTVTVESFLANGIDAIGVAPTDVVTKVTSNNRRMLLLGDSFIEAVIAAVNGDGLGQVAGDMLGFADTWQSGVGGTGYVNTMGGTKFKLSERLFDANATGPWDVIVVAMGINDIGTTPATITAEAATCFASLRVGNPSAQIFVVGAWDVNAPAAPVANYAATKAAIQAAIPAGQGFTFLDPQGVAYTKGDAVHPDTAGHKTLGDWLALQIKTALGA